jgi:hypothetical protein
LARVGGDGRTGHIDLGGGIVSQQAKLGQSIQFEVAYPLTCRERFRLKGKWTKKPQSLPSKDVQEGVIVGIRNVFMDNYVYDYDYEDGTTATGDTEQVFLVCQNIYRKPIIVRFVDAKFPEATS